jgi:uncharacterized protein with HEPN domain
MSKREPSVLLEDIRVAVSKIERYIAGLDKQGFLIDEKTSDAVIRNLEIIGEAVKQLPIDFKIQYATLPWSQVAGLRNRIVHDYAGIDLELVWHIITTALPEFARQISQLKDS